LPKVESYIKEEIALLSKDDLIKLVIKAASAHQQFHDYLIVNYIDEKHGEKDLFESAKDDLEFLLGTSYRGISEELRMADMLADCNKRINEFARVCKDKSLEMELIMFVLEKPFSVSTNHFGTCFTRYNQQVYLLVKKAMTLLKGKLHEDYHIQFAPRLNNYLSILHRTSRHLDYIYKLPEKV
jgi:hypothetical protein